MSKDYWEKIKQRLEQFCKMSDEIRCIQVFRMEKSQCELCDYPDITWNHVLMNVRTHKTIIVGSCCVVNYRKIMVKRGLNNKILYFDKYRKAAEFLNNKYEGTALIIPFPSQLGRIENTLSRSQEQNSKEWAKDRAKADIEDYWAESSEGFHEEADYLDLDECSPEGTGFDEIDWDAHDFE